MSTYEYGAVRFGGNSSSPSHFLFSIGEEVTADLAGVPLTQEPLSKGIRWTGNYMTVAAYLGRRGWRVIDIDRGASGSSWWLDLIFERSSGDKPTSPAPLGDIPGPPPQGYIF